jgi:hypothetical protein
VYIKASDFPWARISRARLGLSIVAMPAGCLRAGMFIREERQVGHDLRLRCSAGKRHRSW